jgi:hypothetical protein
MSQSKILEILQEEPQDHATRKEIRQKARETYSHYSLHQHTSDRLDKLKKKEVSYNPQTR